MSIAPNSSVKSTAIKSAKHHWWPQCVSKRWRDASGKLYQLNPDGKVIPHSNSKEYGAIRDGHTVKLAKEPTFWDVSFEGSFQNADTVFPKLLDWLEALPYKPFQQGTALADRFTGLDVPQENLMDLTECILSLIIRSPKFRNHIHLFNATVQGQKGLEIEKTKKNLVNLNMLHAFKSLKLNMGDRGKYALLFSKNEFIFGDGFYSNFASTWQLPIDAFALVPFLPNLAVLYHCPRQYTSDPRLVSIELDEVETNSINESTMIYSKDSVFYRSQKPQMNESFRERQFHTIYPHSPYLQEFLRVFTQTRFPTGLSNS